MNRDEPSVASHVILMREAEGRPDFDGSDADRPLSAAGREAVVAAARAMHAAGHHPGPLVAASSARARETVQILAAELGVGADDVYFEDGLFDVPPEVLEARMKVLATAYTLVTLVADNPALTDLARFLARQPDAAPLQPAEWRYLPWPPP